MELAELKLASNLSFFSKVYRMSQLPTSWVGCRLWVCPCVPKALYTMPRSSSIAVPRPVDFLINHLFLHE